MSGRNEFVTFYLMVLASDVVFLIMFGFFWAGLFFYSPANQFVHMYTGIGFVIGGIAFVCFLKTMESLFKSEEKSKLELLLFVSAVTPVFLILPFDFMVADLILVGYYAGLVSIVTLSPYASYLKKPFTKRTCPRQPA